MSVLESQLITSNSQLWQQPNGGLARPDRLVTRIQDEELLRIMGPCALQSKEQIESLLSVVADNVDAVRAPGKKPRTRPVTTAGELVFEGIGLEKTATIFQELLHQHPQLIFACEAMSGDDIVALEDLQGLAWIGSRTQQQETCRSIGVAANEQQIPVMVKNPMSADLELFLGMIENTILGAANGVPLLLCLRGTVPTTTEERHNWRNVPNLEWLPILLESFPQLPILVDPSHMLNKKDLSPEKVVSIVDQAIDKGAKGFIIELNTPAHPSLTDPGVDAEQTLDLLVRKNLA